MIRIVQLGLTENYYGTEKAIMNTYKAIDKKKVQFDFLVHHSTPRLPYETEIEEMGGKVYREYFDYSEKKSYNYISPKQFFKNHPEIKGIHYNVNKFTPVYRYIEAAKKIGIPIRVIHSHNSGNMNKSSIKAKVYNVYVKSRLRWTSTDLIACSKLAGRWNFGRMNFEVINNSIDVEKYKYNKIMRNIIREKYNLQGKFVVGFIGRLQYQKNPEFTVKIYKELKKKKPNSVLVILGDGELYQQVLLSLKQQNLKDVYMLGRVDNVEDWLQAFDCFLFPSRFEGLGIALVEAQATGLQCYTSKDVVPREVNITEKVEFISLADPPAEWARRILERPLSERKDMSDKIINAGYDFISLGNTMTKIYEKDYMKNNKKGI